MVYRARNKAEKTDFWSNKIMTNDVIERTETMDVADASVIGAIAQAELDTLITTARRYPRSISSAQKRMFDLATLDDESAADAIYSLPRDRKTVEGPSIRFAELASQAWGNSRVAARTVTINKTEKWVEAEGFFLDAETNVATLARIRRRISTKGGGLFNDDMILVTCNAAQSIARRNAILAGIPKAVWRKAYDGARHVIMGDLKTLANRRADAVKSFTRFGLTEAQVLALMGVKGIEDIDQERLVPLRGMYSALHNQETTVEELLGQIEPSKAPRVTAATASMTAPAHFATDGLPSVDDAPIPTSAASTSEVTSVGSKPSVTPAGQTAPVQEQATMALEPDSDDSVIDMIAETLAKPATQATLAKVWKSMAGVIESLEPGRKAKADQLYAAAVERVGPRKQAAE